MYSNHSSMLLQLNEYRLTFSTKFPMHDNVDLRVLQSCEAEAEAEHEIVFVTIILKKYNFRFRFANFTKQVNNQTNCVLTYIS